MGFDVPREKLAFSQLRDSSCVTQVMLNTGYGLGLSLFAALSSFTMKYPNLSACRRRRARAARGGRWLPPRFGGAWVQGAAPPTPTRVTNPSVPAAPPHPRPAQRTSPRGLCSGGLRMSGW